jgi:GAF domain-containing protein
MGDETPTAGGPRDTLSALQSLLLSTPDVEQFLAEVTRLAADSVTSPASVGVTTASESGLRTVAASDERAALVDEEQYGDGEGPCLEALRVGKFIEVEDQLIDDRWPAYRDKAVELGVRCSLSYPLTVQDRVVGALNVYGFERPHGFTEEDRQGVATFATQAATALAVAMRFAKQAEISEQLEVALTSRSVIDQAIGVLMGQQRCDADTAFALLRSHSQNNNRKLRDVAIDLITRITGQPPTEGRTFNRGNG